MTSRIMAAPTVRPVETLDGKPALLLAVGRDGWPVLIAPDDFDLVTAATGFRLWGVQGRNVVVGEDEPRAGRPVVARILAKLGQGEGLTPAFRDGNPFNLLRSNLGITSRASRKTWWLMLRPGEVDPVYDVRGFPNAVPAAITRHRPLVPEPRPMSCPWPLPARVWHRNRPPKVGTLDGPPPDYVDRPSKGPRIIGLVPPPWFGKA